MTTLRRLWLLLLLWLASCSATEQQRQRTALNAIAAFANGIARPAILEASRLQCDPSRLCPSPPCEQVVSRTLQCFRSWDLVVLSYDRAADAHDAWRSAVQSCPQEGACEYQVTQALQRFGSAFTAYRCQVRAVGRMDLDAPLPPPSCGDGGTS